MHSLIRGVTSADIRRDPFPHIVIDSALDPADYDALAACFPPASRLAWTAPPDGLPSNRRFILPADSILSADDMPEPWKRFVSYHSSEAFLAEVAALFAGCWEPALLDALGGGFDGHGAARLRPSEIPAPGTTILQDARIEINTPVRDAASSVRGAHLDTPNRLYSGLFYMRAPEDDSEGGDLILYRWRGDPPARIDAHVQPAERVEEYVRLPYRANRLVLFPQSIHALHGVSPRQPTPHVRRYVFVTAELTRDWLRAP